MNARLDLPDKQVLESNPSSVLQDSPHREPGVLHRNSNVQIDAQGLPLVHGKADVPAGEMPIEELLAQEVQAQADEVARLLHAGAGVVYARDTIHGCEEAGS